MEITLAHCTGLRNCLERQHPDRDSPEYDAFELDVLGLTFSAEAFSPRPPDNNNEDRARDDDDPEALASNEDGTY